LIVISNSKISFYGGSEFEVVKEFIHPGVSYVSVSPCEKYFYSYT